MDAPYLNGVARSLFIRRTASGDRWEFVILDGGGCAVLFNGEQVLSGDASEGSIEHTLNEFLRTAGAGWQGGRVAALPPSPRAD